MSMDDEVRQAIRDCGLTRYAISKASGVTQGALARFMAGERGMALKTLDKIAPVIGVRLVVHRPRRAAKASGPPQDTPTCRSA